MIATLLMVVSVNGVLDCAKYVCDKSVSLSTNVCIGENSNIYYLSQCTDLKNSYCPVVFNLQNVTCTVPPSPYHTAYPGERCSHDQDCLYGICNGNFCYGQEYGGDCNTHGECNPGLRCDPGLLKCNILMDSLTSGCVDDYDCLTDMGCDAGYCVPYYSIPIGGWVNNCTDSLSNFCESGQCLYGLCISPVKNSEKIPAYCGQNSDCVSDNLEYDGIKIYGTCSCGYGTQGFSYCSLFVGDKPYQELIDVRQTWISTNSSAYCNTLRRWNKQCILAHGSAALAVKFDYLSLQASFYPEIQHADTCVLEIVYSEYYQDYLEIYSSGYLLALGLGIISIL